METEYNLTRIILEKTPDGWIPKLSEVAKGTLRDRGMGEYIYSAAKEERLVPDYFFIFRTDEVFMKVYFGSGHGSEVVDYTWDYERLTPEGQPFWKKRGSRAN